MEGSPQLPDGARPLETLWSRLVRVFHEDVRRLVMTGVPHFFVALALTQGITMLRRILLVRILEVGELGQMTYVMQIADFVAIVADLGVSTSVLKYVAEPVTDDQKRRLYGAGLVWGTLLAVLVSSVYLAVVLAAGLKGDTAVHAYMLMVAPYIALAAVVKTPLVFMQARKQIKRAARFTAITQAVSLVLLVGGTYLFGLWGFFALVTAAPLTNLALLLLATRRDLSLVRPTAALIRKFTGFGFFSMLANVTGYANAAVSVILLRYLTGSDEQVGIYGVGLLVFNGFRLVPTALLQVAFPYLSGLLNDPDRLRDRMRELSQKQAAVMAAVAAAWLLIGRWAIALVFGARFEDAFWPSEVLLVGLIGFAASAAHGQTILILRRVFLNFGVSVLQLVVNVGLGLLLIPDYGIVGAAGAVSAAQVIAAVATAGAAHIAMKKGFAAG